MKTKLLITMAFVGIAMIFNSCTDDSTEGLTRITYYPELTLEGDKTLYLDKGASFTDPGYTAILNGEDVSDQVEISTNLNTNKSGIYTISYSIVNADGFSSSASRKVIVTDPNDAIEGIYYTDPESYRLYNGAQVAYGNSFTILILNNGDGTYSVDDLLGGWYCQRAGYGSNYAMQGIISVSADGSIDMLASYVPGWGNTATGMTNGKFEDGTITWNLEYTDYPFFFIVTMYKR